MRQTLEEVLKEMEETEKNRQDLNVPLHSLIMQDDGILRSYTYGDLEPSKAATNRLCNMYKLSSSHLDVLKQSGREDLVAETFNHFLINDKSTKKLRIVDDNRIKGIVNKDYKKFDDYDLFRMVDEYLSQYGFDYNLEVINKNDEYTRIRFAISDIERNMGMADENGSDEDIVQGGFEITNSEIGLKGMSLNSLIYRQICTNGMMGVGADTENNELFYNRDKRFTPFSRQPMLTNGLTNAIERSNNNIDLFQKTKGIKIEEPKDEIQKIGNRYNLGKKHVEGVQDSWKHERQYNYFGVLNGLTRYAKDEFSKHDYRNRAKFETIANDVMEKVTA